MTDSALDYSCRRGCAKIALDPKLHEFDDCFDGKIRMGDIDGAVERNGHILWVEWKRYVNPETFQKQHLAQFIMARAFTTNSPRQMFTFVVGCPLEMRVERFMVIEKGTVAHGGWIEGDIERFKSFLRFWFKVADNRAVAA